MFIVSDELSSMNPAGRVPGITAILQKGQKSIFKTPQILCHLSPAGFVVELDGVRTAGVRLQGRSLKPELKSNLLAEKFAIILKLSNIHLARLARPSMQTGD